QQWSWPRAFATLYSDCAELFRFQRGQEHRLEALAHLGRGERAAELRQVFRYVDGTLQVDDGWRTHIDRMMQRDVRRHGQAIDAARAVQYRVGGLVAGVGAVVWRR